MSVMVPGAADLSAMRAPRRGGGMLCVMLALMLFFFIWAGSGPNPGNAMPWGWTATGWLTLSRGLAFLWVASAALFAVLSRLAYRLFTSLPARQRSGIVTMVFIAMICVVVNAGILWWWHPLSLIPTQPAATFAWRVGTAGAAFATFVVLLIALARTNRSAWWAVLFALHPLTLLETAGNGAAITVVALPLLLLAIVVEQGPSWMRRAGMIAFVVAAVGVAAWVATRVPFNSISAALLGVVPGRELVGIAIIEAILQGVVLFVAWRREWAFDRTLTHVGVMLLIGMMTVVPAMVVVVLPLLVLAWNRAAWVLSLTVLLAYAAIPAQRVTHHWMVPGVLVALEWVPVVVVELQELFVRGHAEV